MPDPTERLNAALEGRYSIESELGKSRMATCYLAADLPGVSPTGCGPGGSRVPRSVTRLAAHQNREASERVSHRR